MALIKNVDGPKTHWFINNMVPFSELAKLCSDIMTEPYRKTKLYKVVLMDNEDGGHVRGEATYLTARRARSEFLRIRDKIFTGYWDDQPDEWSYHRDDHFTHYHNSEFDLRIVIQYTGESIDYFVKYPKEDRETFVKLFDDPEDEYSVSIASIFEYAVEQASRWCTLRDFRNGFKKIYDFVKPRLASSFVRCEYSKGCETNPCQMDYFVIGRYGEDAVVTVSEENGIYSFHITF